LFNAILGQVEKVAQRLRLHKLTAQTITLKFRYGDFKTITRSRKLKEASNTTETLWQMSKNIFQQWCSQSRGALRLIGFEASGLTKEDSGQKLLFEDIETKKQKRLDETIDKIRQKYGDDSVQRKY
jgi:nucleotidyltransferase/DNA polymerase involved in DNA repair